MIPSRSLTDAERVASLLERLDGAERARRASRVKRSPARSLEHPTPRTGRGGRTITAETPTLEGSEIDAVSSGEMTHVVRRAGSGHEPLPDDAASARHESLPEHAASRHHESPPDEAALARHEPLVIERIDPSENLQQRLGELIDEIVEHLGAEDGFVADESGLQMAGPDSCEDCAARSSLAWRFYSGPDSLHSPQRVSVSQGDGRTVHHILLPTSLGRIIVGVRSKVALEQESVETLQTALAEAFSVD